MGEVSETAVRKFIEKYDEKQNATLDALFWLIMIALAFFFGYYLLE